MELIPAWLQVLQALLPPGAALTHAPGAVLTNLLEAIAAVLAQAQSRLEVLQKSSSSPGAGTGEMLPEWERLLGLTGVSQDGSALTLQERTQLAFAQLLDQGGQSRAYFIALAERLGEPGCTIDELGENVWRVNIPRAVGATRPMNCNDNCNSALLIFKHSLIEGPISDRRPAHTTVQFAYAGA